MTVATRRTRRILHVVLGGFFVGISACGGFLVLQPRVREWLYRETSYRVILRRIVAAVPNLDPETVVRTIADHVHRNMYQGGGPVVDADSWTHLVRGIGWCDQKAWTIATLLAIQGIPARLVLSQSHTVLEVLLNDRWCLLDPAFNFMVRNPTGSWATIEEIQHDPSLLASQPILQGLAPEARERILASYQALRLSPLQRWTSVLERRLADHRKVFAERAIAWLYSRWGSWWAYPLQDGYLAWRSTEPITIWDDRLSSDLERGVTPRQLAIARRWYSGARNYHLYGRYEQAKRLYHRILEQYPETAFGERSSFWLGVVAFRQGDGGSAIEGFSRFLNLWPASLWRTRAYDWLTLLYGQRGDGTRQQYFQRLALTDPLVPTASRITAALSQR